MHEPATSAKPNASVRRGAAVRTAWIVGGIALAVYAGFILMGVLDQ